MTEPGSRRASGVPGRSMSLVPSKNSIPGKKVSNKVIINVGGVRYETYKSTLRNIPDTRLSWLTENTAQTNADYDAATGEFFFDRHPSVFNMILNYYRTGRLHAPTDVCGPMFEEELSFWGIDEKQIEPCCWMQYRTHRDAQETLAELDLGEDGDDDDDDDVALRFGIHEEDRDVSCWQRWQPKVWTILEEPSSSKGAQVVATISLMFVLLSIATFCLETDLAFRVQRNSSIPKNSSWTKSEKTLYTEVHPSLDYLDYICIAYFTLEFIVRFAFCPNKATFFKVLLNWVDLLSILPFYFEQLILFIESSLEDSGMIQLLNSMRLIRIFRIFKLTRHFSGLKIIGHTVRASAKELALLIMFMMITVLIFACLIYYAEAVKEHELNKFKTIPVGFWWALVTMTTLGYGDFYPRTGLGYIVGAMCALAGVLVLALPVPIIVNNFSLYYSHAQARAKLPKKRKRVLVGAADALKTQGMDEEANLENVLPGLPPSGPAPPSNAPAAAAVAAPTPARPKSPGSHSNDSVNSETRKGSAESDNSVDSGIKTGDSNTSNESCGISVIFTDEVGETTIMRRLSPPRNQHSGLTHHGHSGLGVSNGGTNLMVPNGPTVASEVKNQANEITTEKEVRKRNSLLPQNRVGPPPRRLSLRPLEGV